MEERKDAFVVGALGCQGCVFFLNLLAFGLWMTMGTMYTVMEASQCVSRGGPTECEFYIRTADATNYFSERVIPDNYTAESDDILHEALVVIRDDSPIYEVLTSDDSLGIALDKYQPAGLLVAGTMAACIAIAMGIGKRVVKEDKEESGMSKIALTVGMTVFGKALAGSLAGVTCEEQSEGIWESSIDLFYMLLWVLMAFILFSGLVAVGAEKAGCNGLSKAAGFVACITVMFNFGCALFIIVNSTINKLGSIEWEFLFTKLLAGSGNDCVGGGASVGIQVATILAMGCGFTATGLEVLTMISTCGK